MKTNRFVNAKRILSVLAIAAVLVCALCVFATANDAASLEVGLTNLKYDSYTHIIVTLNGEAPAGATKGIAVWNIDVDEPTADNVSYYNFVEETDPKGTKFFSTKGIPASELSEALYIAPAVKDADGNVALAGEAVAKSAFAYVTERLAEDTLAGYQINLYRDLIVYGTAAEQVLGDKVANNNVVVAKNGYVGETYMPLVVAPGETALLRAGVQNANGEYFSHWEDIYGNFVSGERLVSVDVKAGLNYYNAIYTDKATSAYGDFADFQAFDAGKHNFTITTSELTDTEKANGVANRFLPMYGDKGFRSQIKFDVSDLTLATLPITAEDTLTFNTLYDGVKYLNYNKTLATSSEAYQGILNYESTDKQYTYERFEMDINLAATSQNATTCFMLNFNKDGGGYAKFQFYIGRSRLADGSDGLCIHYYPEGQTVKLDIPYDNLDKVFTMGIDVDEYGVLNIYIDGEKLQLAAPAAPYSGSLSAGTWHPGLITIANPGAVTWDYNIYSIGLVDTDKTKAN